jgi:acetyltransferase-like isoleucine patch superfamily enzyme
MFANNGSRIASFLISFLPASRWHKFKTWLLRHIGGVQIGENCEIWSGAKFVGSHITIGDECFISNGVTISGLSKVGYVKIGNNCALGPEVYITTGTHHIGSAMRRSGPGIFKPIVIGDGCGLSVRSIPLAGVTIGSGCVIGPGVVVSKDIPPNTLLAQAFVRSFKLPESGVEW